MEKRINIRVLLEEDLEAICNKVIEILEGLSYEEVMCVISNLKQKKNRKFINFNIK